MDKQTSERLQAKTPERRFLQVLEQDFQYAPKVAQAILEEAQTCLLGAAERLRLGQVRVILTRYDAAHGRAMRDTETTEVTWTLDVGLEDRQVASRPLSYEKGMTSFLYQYQIRIFDYQGFAQPLRDIIRANADVIAQENGLAIEFVRKSK